ncbi:TNKS [Symbiodinium necroappetens]|uniref:TNKS protein n=1 Tax=Symbiodinium necroappetens TaxID=1628268 RepID=A0A812LMK0_9DINO|nr:TNKS [Symbiodinium necroappetens]
MTTRQDERGWTPLDCADEAGEVEVSNLLVAHAPDADLGKGGAMHPVLAAAVTAVENYGWQAVHEGRREWTALHWAASEGNKALCARLLLHDADPSQVDQAGRSALDYARNAGHRSTYESSSPLRRHIPNRCGYLPALLKGRSRKQSPDEDKEIGIHNELLASVSDLSDLELSVLGSVDLSEQPALLKELKLHGCRLFGVPEP